MSREKRLIPPSTWQRCQPLSLCRCARANILLGDTEMGQGRPQAAIEYWKGLEGQNPAYISLVAEKLLAAHRSLGREDDQTVCH